MFRNKDAQFSGTFHLGVVRAQGLFPNRHRPLVKGFGLLVLTLFVVKRRQVV
jgi:hypothetical protein